MKVSGFTFCRNVVKYDYPVVESIRSILPIVDEFIVNVGRCEDGTLELIRSIGDPKIRIVESVWDESLKKDGLIYSQQTNIALAQCTGDWAVYVQGDEVIHEQDLPALTHAMKANLDNRSVKGLLFRYLHFMGDYWSLNPWFYHRAVRVIRNNGEIESCGDAVGFHVKATHQYLQSGPREWLADSGARMFHYGWVKEPKTMLAKKREQVTVYTNRLSPDDERQIASEDWIFEEYDILKNFTGTHPAVMRERVNRFQKLKPGRNRWLEPAFYRAIAKKGFRG
ncbi:MAG: glycosyltransferase [Nitrospiraceae bacterium]|nr:glycosyltransferase [Nitrospiraceae bacterium]